MNYVTVEAVEIKSQCVQLRHAVATISDHSTSWHQPHSLNINVGARG